MLEVAEHRWYTTFAIEPSLSGTTIAGTLERIGPFRVCNIVHHDIRTFRRWYRRRKAEEAEKLRAYLERERKIEAEWRARREQQQREAALLKEAERVAYRHAHAAELAAEAVIRAVWPVESRPASQADPDFVPFLQDEDDDLFLDTEDLPPRPAGLSVPPARDPGADDFDPFLDSDDLP